MITLTITELIKYIMNNQPISINKVATHFNRTSHFIRSEIQTSNYFLPKHNQIDINNAIVSTALTYDDFLSLMHSLNINSYVPNQLERIKVIVVLSYFTEVVNVSDVYRQWGISLTTKKKDMHALEEYLNSYNLQLKRIPGKGISVTGNLLRYRVLIVRLLSFCIDVSGFTLTRREANTPIENMIFNTFYDNVSSQIELAHTIIDTFMVEYQHQVNYYSKKFFIAYILLALWPTTHKQLIIEELTLKPLNFFLIDDLWENRAFNQVAAMIDFYPMVSLPYHRELLSLVERMYHRIIKTFNYTIYTDRAVIEEMYIFIYRQYFFNHFQYIYEDKLVKTTDIKYPKVYDTIDQELGEIASFLNTSFHKEQISSLTLILMKWISKNQIYGDKRKKIIIVTNIGSERVLYFLQKLHESIHFELVDTVDINEIERLKVIDFDLLITFSNRMYTILKRHGYLSLKLKYFIESDDVMKLINAGCSIASTRLRATDLINQLENLTTKEEKVSFLTSQYDDLFI